MFVVPPAAPSSVHEPTCTRRFEYAGRMLCMRLFELRLRKTPRCVFDRRADTDVQGARHAPRLTTGPTALAAAAISRSRPCTDSGCCTSP